MSAGHRSRYHFPHYPILCQVTGETFGGCQGGCESPPPIPPWNLFHLQRLSECVRFVYLQLPVAANDSIFCPSILFCSDNNLRVSPRLKLGNMETIPPECNSMRSPPHFLSFLSQADATHVGWTQTCHQHAGTEKNPSLAASTSVLEDLRKPAICTL